MAVNTPQFENASGTLTEELTLVTTVREQFLTGSLDADVVDVQVKINDGSFVSDATLINFDQDSFTVPNPAVYPEGLRLDYDTTTIQIRVVDVTGAVSSAATASIRVVRKDDLKLFVEPPSGLRVRRHRDSVELVWSKNNSPNVVGYNVYAAVDSGGAGQGYTKINKDLITEVDFEEEELRQVNEDNVFFDSQGGQLRLLYVEEDFTDTPLKTVSDSTVDMSRETGEVQVTTNVSAVDTTEYFSFTHDRQATEDEGVINNERFVNVPDDEPLYYVITAVAYDTAANEQVESDHSSELVGLPLTINTQLSDIDPRTQDDVRRDYLSSILRANNQVSGIPGSSTRDIFVDPFANEAERMHFIAGFIHRSQSFATLLAIDDLDGDGISDLVSESPYKQALKSALGIENDQDVQALIDDSFDKLASNSDTTRGGAEFAIGQVTFFTTTRPTEDEVVPEGTLVATENTDGGGSVTFTVTSRVTLPVDALDSYYNVKEKRWEIQANIRAVEPGEDSNVTSQTIKRVIGGPTNLQVINPEATRFGRNAETNRELAERAILAFSGVDSGTGGGYTATALSQPGVFRVNVVKSQDASMMRDYDPLRKKHIGGKVDIWIQGLEEQTVTDNFALVLTTAENQTFVLDSSPSDLIFKAVDPRLGVDQPITEMLGATTLQANQGFGLRNVSTGQDFDLTGYTILDHNRIQLDNSIAQPAVGVNDVITGDYRFQKATEYVFSRQPVRGVASVRSLNTNTVLEEGTHWDFHKLEDPLLRGQSTQAEDQIRIQQSGGIPSGSTFVVNDERHVLVGQTPEALNNIGVNSASVRVFTLDRMAEYNGPNSPNPDYLIEEGDEVTPLNIVRVPTGQIENGEEVSIDYEHDENFAVTYTLNNLLSKVQARIEEHRHVTADVLVKQGIITEVDLEMTVVLEPGANQSQVDADLQTAISQLLNSKGIGQPIYQSDIVQAVENTKGVVFVVVPFSRMALSDSTLIVRETINSASTVVEQTGQFNIHALRDALEYPTKDGGGDDLKHHGVFQDTQPLELVDSYADLQGQTGRALIIGASGFAIPGYSDNPTLNSQGYTTSAEQEARRKELTANRVFVSIDTTDRTANHRYSATYEVFGDKGSKSIVVGDVSFLELGNLTITYQRG